jgi:prophage DNA circulation protein
MSWRDELLPASFRGVPFFVESNELTLGRRVVRHEFPLKQVDPTFPEDVGRLGRSFSVDAIVLGPDYLSARNALLTALEVEGPGELVHPYYGTRRVQAGQVRVRETAADGGMARFAIPFDEAPARPTTPTAVVNAPAVVRSSAAKARVASQDTFLATYSPGPRLTSVAGLLRAATVQVKSALARVSLETQDAAAMDARVRNLQTDTLALAESPAGISLGYTDLFAAFNPSSYRSLLYVYGFNPGIRPPSSTPNRVQEQANFDTAQRFVQRLALIRATEIAIGQTFGSYEDAAAARDELGDLLDEQMASDDAFPALMQLRADLARAVPGDGSDLPHLLSFTPTVTVPALVLAQRLYGDPDRAEEIIARNHIRHPGFVRGGVTLEILSDV